MARQPGICTILRDDFLLGTDFDEALTDFTQKPTWQAFLLKKEKPQPREAQRDHPDD